MGRASPTLPTIPGGPPGRVVLANWRVAIHDRAARLLAALDRIPEEQGHPDYATVQSSIEQALTAARFLPADAPRAGRFRSVLTSWMGSGNQTDSAWMAVHRGEEALMGIADVATLKADALRVYPAVARMPAGDPLVQAYFELLARLGEPVAGSGHSGQPVNGASAAVPQPGATMDSGSAGWTTR